MSFTPSIPAPYPVIVHSYLPSPSPSSSSTTSPSHLQTYEHLPDPNPRTRHQPVNALVFIGGLGDGPHTIPYVRHLAAHLAQQQQTTTGGLGSSYSVFEARLSSAHSAFGYASLAQDARELAHLVRYLRRGLGKRRVVLMGHSTGCQDCLEYAAALTRAVVVAGGDGEGEGGEEVRVDGLVLQGPVSDREAIAMGEDPGEVRAALGVAEGMVREGKGGEVMGREALPGGWRGSPVTAYRWASLAGVG